MLSCQFLNHSNLRTTRPVLSTGGSVDLPLLSLWTRVGLLTLRMRLDTRIMRLQAVAPDFQPCGVNSLSLDQRPAAEPDEIEHLV